MRYPHRQKIG